MTEGEAIVANATIGLAFITAGLVLATLLLVWAAVSGQASTRRADVEFVLRPWHERAGTLLEGRLENFGPASARNLHFTLHVSQDGAPVVDATSDLKEPLFPAGLHRFFLPRTHPAATISSMAEIGIVFEAQWSWEDDRNVLPLRGHTRRKTFRKTAGQIKDDYYPGHAILEKDVATALTDISKELEAIRKVVVGTDLAAQMRRQGGAIYVPDDLPLGE